MNELLFELYDHELTEEFHRRNPELKALSLRGIQDRTDFGVDGQAPVFTIEPDRGEWILRHGQCHVHRQSFDSAVDTLKLLVIGEARFCTERRGDTLAASWLEVRKGQHFERQDHAVFLTPFDPDEWELWAEEKWNVSRTSWLLDDGTLNQTTHERIFEASHSSSQDMQSWLPTALGQPLEGLRWKLGFDSRFIFQAPRSWRRTQPDAKGTNVVDFAPASPGLLLRARNYYRPSASPANIERGTSVTACSIESRSESENGWHCDRWTMVFLGGEDDMLGILELFHYPSLGINAEPFRHLIEETIGQARYVPKEWEMETERA